jgi:hypothetical protein
LVRKIGGVANGKLLAIKIINTRPMASYDEDHWIEFRVHKKISNDPFLVGVHYAFQKPSKMALVLGEYIKSIPDSKTYEK